MSRKVWFLIFSIVLMLHAGLFLLIKDGPALPQQWFIDRSPPEPTFKYGEARYIDPDTGEKMIVQEFTLRAPNNKNENNSPGNILSQPGNTLSQPGNTLPQPAPALNP